MVDRHMKTLREKITILVIQAMSEFAVEKENRKFGEDLSDITKKWTNELESLFKKEMEEIIGEDDYVASNIDVIDSIYAQNHYRNNLRQEMREKLK